MGRRNKGGDVVKRVWHALLGKHRLSEHLCRRQTDGSDGRQSHSIARHSASLRPTDGQSRAGDAVR
jgi:hypothetical protein